MRKESPFLWTLAAGLAAAAGATAVQQVSDGRGAAEARSGWSLPQPLLAGAQACPTQHRAALALRGDGTMVAVWYDGRDSRLARLLWAERARDASHWSAARAVGPFALGYHGDGPARMTKLADGSLVLAWRAGVRNPEASRPLRLARIEAAGGAWRQIAAPAGTSSRLNTVELAAGPNGLHAAWEDGEGIAYARRATDGVWRRPERLRPPGRKVRVETSGGLAPMATSGFAPIIAAAPGGAVLVGWWDDERTIGRAGGHPFDLIVRVREPGQTWSPMEPVPGARSPHPYAAAAATPRGFTLVSVGADHRLEARWRPLRTGKWSTAIPVPDGPGLRAIEPALLAGGDGRLLLTWRSFAKESNLARAAMVGGDGRFVDLFASPVPSLDNPEHGGLFDARGAPVAWFSNPSLVAPCVGIVWSEMVAVP